MRFFSICFFLISLLFPAISLSQDAVIKGNITDAGTPETLIGVNVVLEDKLFHNTGTASDIDGNYELKVSEGKHTILYRYIGYTSQKKTIDIKAGETLTIDIAMKEKATELGTVVVSAGKFEQKIEDVTVSMEVISPNIVENKATTNIEQAINQAPGVQIIDTDPQIRGGSGYSFGAGARVMVMVDDMPILSGDAGRAAWEFLPIENLEQIEILKGASSVLYGSSALSGVINIRTAYPKDKPQTKINVYSGMYDKPQRKYAVAHWGEGNPVFTGMNFFHSRKIKNLDLVIGGYISLDDGIIGPAPEIADSNNSVIAGQKYHVPETPGDFENSIRMNTNLRYRPKKVEGLNYGINLNAMYSQFTSKLIMLNTDTGMYRSYPGGATRTLLSTFYIDPFINYFDKQGNKYSIKSRVYYVDNNNDNKQANKSTVYFFEPQYQKQFKKIKDFTIISGIMATYSYSDSEIYARIIDDGDSTTIDTVTTDINAASNIAGYLQLDKKFLDRITVSAGTRWERFQINSDSAESKPVFRAGVSAKVLKETYIRSSFGQGFRFPTVAERFVNTSIGGLTVYSNPDLESERSWNAEVGIKQGIKIGEFYGYLDLAVFQQEITNSIEFNVGRFGAPVPPLYGLGFKSINVKEARIRGIDVSIVSQGNLGPVTLNILAGYTYTNPVTLHPDDTILEIPKAEPITYKNSSSDTTGNLLKYRFEHLAKADVELTYSKYSMGVSFRYNSFMKNVDEIFEFLDKDSGAPPLFEGQLPTGIKQYREEHNKGDYVFDIRASYKMSETSKVAFIVKNLLNREYMIRPLQIQPPRTFTVQYTLTF